MCEERGWVGHVEALGRGAIGGLAQQMFKLLLFWGGAASGLSQWICGLVWVSKKSSSVVKCLL